MPGGCMLKALLRVAVMSIMLLRAGRRSLVASTLAAGRAAAATARDQISFWSWSVLSEASRAWGVSARPSKWCSRTLA